MPAIDRRRSVLLFVCAAALAGAGWSARVRAQTPDKGNGLVGAWTLDKAQSDQPQSTAPSTDEGRPSGGRRGGGGRGRGGFGGGFGGGGRGRTADGGQGAARNADAAARLREAMRDVTDPPDHLTIVATESMIVMTAPDGRTTRLSPDGKGVKDENTNIVRKTKWDGAKLVSEISGLGAGKITETYAVDAEKHQLHLTAQVEGGGGAPARTISHVYDLDPR
jgi:hypothetical protein